MYYLLNSNYGLRGWSNVPYAIIEFDSGKVQPINEFTYSTISLCNGQIHSALLLKPHLELIEKLEKNKIVSCTEIPKRIDKRQEYQKMPYRFILKAHWSVTGKCNLKCRHCYMSAPQAKYGELTTEQCFYIIDQLCTANIGTVSLTGGEPLVRKDFWTIVDRLLSKGISISQIYTNGMLVNKAFVENLKKRGLSPEISVSFDGIGTHDWLRGVEGAEKKVVEAIRLLVEHNIQVSVEMSLNKQNIDNFTDSVFLLADLGVSSIKATPTSDSGNWVNEKGCYSLNLEEAYDAYMRFITKYRAAGAPVSIMLGGFFYCRKGSEEYVHPIKRYNGSEEMKKHVVCGSAGMNMYIAADGKILPCIPLSGMPIQATMPNLLETPLVEILDSSVYLKMVALTLGELLAVNDECNRCEYKLVCGGGCRASALMDTGNYSGKDPASCLFFHGNYEEKVRRIYSTD